MAFTRYQFILAVLMVATGSLNTLTTKWADRLPAVGRDGILRKYDHPFVQACAMFLGEIFCLIAFKVMFQYYTKRRVVVEDIQVIRGNSYFDPFLFLPPAMLDMIATSIMYIGLKLTYVSSFQMLRGSVIVFVALMSKAVVPGREITAQHWTGIFCIIGGLVVVGASDFLLPSSEKHDVNSIITGDLLVIIAQIITACQMVYEEKFVVDKDIPPLQAVGWEGIFGFCTLGFLLIPFYFIPVGRPFADNSHHSLEDVLDAFAQMGDNKWIIVATIGMIISIAFFNFAGVSITKELSATARMVLDGVRTFFIWIFGIAFQWQEFHILQLVGFGILLIGMCVYYDILPASVSRVFNRDRYLSMDPIVTQPADRS